MEWFAVLAACVALKAGGIDQGREIFSFIPTDQECSASSVKYQTALHGLQLSAVEREAIARVAYAEAGNQGTSGLAGVVYTILNRRIVGGFGEGVEGVVNAPRQFEPVEKVGGWRNLPAVTEGQQATVDAIINLAQEGQLPDLTKGGLFFQNPEIVQHRADAGSVSQGVVHFGGKEPVAVIKDHAFYTGSIDKISQKKKEVQQGNREEGFISDDEAAAASNITVYVAGAE